MKRSHLTTFILVTVAAVAALAAGRPAAPAATHSATRAAPGQTNGHDLHNLGAGWWVLSPAGKKIEKDGS